MSPLQGVGAWAGGEGRIKQRGAGILPAPRSPTSRASTMTPSIRIGIVTVSDCASRGKYQDLGVPAIRECLLAVFPAIPYCVDLIEGPYLTTNESVVKAFRPKK